MNLSRSTSRLCSRAFPTRWCSSRSSPRVALVFSGCGVFDGTEITEGVASIVSLSRAGVETTVFAPDKEQIAVNHTTGEEHQEERNCLQEAARITRGKITPLSQLQSKDFDALILPGGFGAAKNLSSWAFNGTDCSVDPNIWDVITTFHAEKKVIGACCIAPTLLAKTLPDKQNMQLTVGMGEGDQWPYAGTVQQLQQLGVTAVPCGIDGVVTDADNRLVTAPAYMYEGKPHEVFDNVEKFVHAVLQMIKQP